MRGLSASVVDRGLLTGDPGRRRVEPEQNLDGCAGIIAANAAELHIMVSRNLRPTSAGHSATDQDIDRLILRIRRLAAHRGYDREALMSPMLKRLIPLKKPSGDPVTDMAELRNRIAGAGIAGKAVAYLTESVETELDFARLRLT